MSVNNNPSDTGLYSGDEIVISGISGIFPNSDSVCEFKENLYDKINMVQRLTNHDALNHPEIPKYMGTISGMEKFDAQFFKVHNKQAAVMEPMCRKLLEHTYSAIYDAGLNPTTLKRRKIGVFIATMFCDTENIILYDPKQRNSLALPGVVKSMFANRISFWLDSAARCYTLDMDYSGSLMCLQEACRSIQMGECEAAVVGASNFHTNPGPYINFKRAGLVGLDAKTKSFDVNAEAPARSDAINVIFLQKAKDARRIYCEVYHIKGEYKMRPDAKFLPVRETGYLREFLEEFYSEVDVKPENVEYVEGFGAGIQEADAKELEAIRQVFSSKNDVKVGSVQSNMGNSGAVTGMCSITKLCLAYQKGIIPANINFSSPSNTKNGVQIVTEHTPFHRGFTAMNNISFMGSNYHALFKGHYKPKDLSKYKSEIPYLVLGSGRQENNVNRMLRLLASEPTDPELIGLLHKIHEHDITGHVYRGYAVLDAFNIHQTKPLAQNVQHYNGEIRPIVFVYSGVGSQWCGMGRDLMRLPLIAASIEKCSRILKPKGIDVAEILCSHDENVFEDPLNCFVGIIAMQIALTDLLHEMEIVPECFIGHSMGELGCAYVDRSLTVEQAVQSAFVRGDVSKTNQVHGAMIAVGLGYNDVKHLCPPGIEVACHNSPQSSTLAGPAEAIRQFAKELNNLNIFVREIPSANMASHSSYIAHNEPILFERMSEFMKDPKPRSAKWLTTAFPEHLWNSEAAKYSSAEYHTKNILNPVHFEEAAKHLPKNAILIEVAPHALLQGVMRQCRKDCTYIGLTKRGHKAPLMLLLESIGKMYQAGLNPKVEVLYPKISYPVSTETGLLSHFVGWDHTEDWPVCYYIPSEKVLSKSRTVIISNHDDSFKFLQGHVRGGASTIPEASYFILVWETLAMYYGIDYRNLSVTFQSIEFHEELILINEEPLKLHIMISKSRDDTFEVSCDGRKIVTGIIKISSNKKCNNGYELKIDTNDYVLNSKDIYKILYHKGYAYRDDFQSIKTINGSLTKANIKWTGEWTTLIDSLIQMNTLDINTEGVSIPKYIDQIVISIDKHLKVGVITEDGVNCYIAERCGILGVTRCAGVEIRNMTFVNKPVLAEESSFKIESFQNEIKLMDAVKQNGNIDNYYESTTHNIKLTRGHSENFEHISWTEVPSFKTSGAVKVSFAALSLVDVKVPKYYCNQYTKYLGMDFSGYDINGARVMGVVQEGGVSNAVESDPDLLWPVPENWTLEEAATVPLPFLHAYYCLAVKYSLHKGKTVLITDGAGGLGQAVISLCLGLDCNIFTTVIDETVKRGLLQLFPQLDEKNIGCSEEDAFFLVRQNTNNQRCHVVINNSGVRFSEVGMQCLGQGGFYMDLNGADVNDKMDLYARHLSDYTNHCVVDLYSMLGSNSSKEKKILQNLVAEGIAKGIVRPLSRLVFSPAEAQKALKLVSSRRHLGRVLINMEDCEKYLKDLKIVHRLKLNPEATYVVVCDDTDIGIELANRLVNRGARNLVINKEFDTGYLKFKQRSWVKLNVTSKLSCENLQSTTGCEKLLSVKAKMGRIEGVFVVFGLESNNMIKSDYEINIINKMKNLDDISTLFGEDLSYFVLLAHSSKLTKDSNILKECAKICEERRRCGKPVLLLQAGNVDTNNQHNNAQSNTILKKKSNVLDALETCIQRKYTNVCYAVAANENEFKNQDDKVQNGDVLKGLEFFYKRIEENEINTPEVFVNMTNKISYATEIENAPDPDDAFLLIIPGFDGNCDVFKSISEMFKIQTVAVQLDPNVSNNSIEDTATEILKFVKQRFRLKSKFYIFGYSFGVNVALELAYAFEKEGHVGLVYCLDSSPDVLRVQLQANVGNLSCIQLQDSVIFHMYKLIAKREDEEILNAMKNASDWAEKVNICINRLKLVVHNSHEYMRFLIETAYGRILQALKYEPKFKLQSELILIKSDSKTLAHLRNDYNLSKYSVKPVRMFNLKCDHETAPQDYTTASIVNSLLDPKVLEEFNKNNGCDKYLLDPYYMK